MKKTTTTTKDKPSSTEQGRGRKNPVKIIFPELEENAPLLPHSTIQLGDRVKITNPTSGQLSESIVTHKTKYFLWVETGEGPPIRRKPNNLEIISSPHHNDDPQ